MAILSGPAILSAIERGDIQIDPFDPKLLNPASVDLRLGSSFGRYVPKIDIGRDWNVRDVKRRTDYCVSEIPEDGIVIHPGDVTLMHTVETVYARCYVPVIDGKSSLGRLGVCIHQTAGFGDPGFFGQYTLEVTATHPVRLYAGMRVCQIRFHEIAGEVADYADRGHYVGDRSRGPVPSLAHLQFEKDARERSKEAWRNWTDEEIEKEVEPWAKKP